MTYVELLAQTTQAVNGNGPEPKAVPPASPWLMVGWIVIIVFVFWMLLFRPRKQEQKQHEEMLRKLKKHDKVMTIGGVIGTVMEVRDDEVIVKVDDNSNTRMRFARRAIQKVVVSSGEGGKAAATD